MRIGIDDILAGHGIGTGGGSGGGRLEPKSARVTTSNVTSVVDVPATLGFNPAKDMMMVFQNSIFIDKGVDYTLSEDATTIIATDGDWTVGTILDFLVITNTKTDLPTYDGSLIGDGTITETKLSQAILDRIEASANFDAVLGRVNEVELKMRQLREVAANAQLQMEATDLVTSGQSFGGNGNFSFGAPMDMAKTTTTNILDAGAVVLTGKVAKHDAFKVGQTVTIYDDVNTEAVVVTKSTATELEVSALTKGYKSGAVIARSTLVPHVTGGYDFPKWNEVKGPGVARLNLGITDEAVLWVTKDFINGISLKKKINNVYHDVLETSDFLNDEKVELRQYSINSEVDLRNVDSLKAPGWHESSVQWATAIALDSDGNVFVGYSSSPKKLRKLDKSGKEVWSNTTIPTVTGIATDSDGNVYTVHKVASGKSVYKFDKNGNEIWSRSDIPYATAVAVDNDFNVLVTSTTVGGPASLRKLNSSGTTLWQDTSTTNNGKAVCVDRNSNIYVCYDATGGKVVRKLDSNGAEIWWDSGAFNAYGITVDDYYNVYVTYSVGDGMKSVRKLDEAGKEVWSNSSNSYARGIVVDSGGNVYVGYGSSNSIKFSKINNVGQTVTNLGGSYSVDSLAVDKLGNLYLANNSGSGEIVQTYSSEGNEIWTKDDASPTSSATDSQGNVYITFDLAEGYGNLKKYDRNGILIWEKKDIPRAMCVVVDDLDYIYVSNLASAGLKSVRKLDGDGKELWSDSEIYNAKRIFIDQRRNLYVTYGGAAGTKTIRKFGKDGNELWFDTEVSNAKDICADEFENVYVVYSNSTGKKVRKINKSGNEVWSNSGYGMGSAIRLDSNKNVIVGYMTGLDSLVKFNNDGTVIWSSRDSVACSDLDVDKDDNIYVAFNQSNSSNASLAKFDSLGKILWSNKNVLYGVSIKLSESSVVALHNSVATKTIRKLGVPRKLKTWMTTYEQSKINVYCTESSKVEFFMNDTLLWTSDSSTRHVFSINPNQFPIGLSDLIVRIERRGEEKWTVARDGQRLEVTQWVMSNDEPLPLEIELNLEGEGKLHKYLGAIG